MLCYVLTRLSVPPIKRRMSHIARIFVDSPLKAGAVIDLDEAQSRYLLKVMRLSEGALVRVFNGADGEWACTLVRQGKTARLTASRQTRPQTDGPDIKLLFAPIRRTRTELIIEKATELGVSDIQPVRTAYTQISKLRLDRFALIAAEAAEQTERLDLPRLKDLASLADVLADWDPAIPLIYCDEGGTAAAMEDHGDRLKNAPCGLLIGPEGGFSPKEQQMLRSLDFVVPITLGPRILRAETAAIAALTLWQSLFGDWREAPYLPED